MPPNKNPYPRPKLNLSERKKYVAGLIDQLRTLERKTDPKDGARSAKDKRLLSLAALKIANDLVNALAGWALDHQAGLALKELKSVPLKTVAKPPEHPDYSNSTDDDHRHEWYGKNWAGRDGPIDPIVARKWLINLVYANSGIFSRDLRLMTVMALEACDFGEIQPLLMATKKSRKVNWTILQLYLDAIRFVKYRDAHGLPINDALQEVAGAFAVSVHTVRSWKQRLQTEFGHSSIASVLADSLELIESDAQFAQELKESARQFRSALAEKSRQARVKKVMQR